MDSPQSLIPNEILLAPSQVKRDSQSRLPDASAARQGLNQLLKEDLPRSYERAIVQGCYDGNAPYSARKLKQDGQNWRCNLNFRGLEGTMDSARIPYYGLLSGVPTYATFKVPYVFNPNPEVTHWEQCTADKFTDLMNRWRQFKWHLQSSQFEMLFEGWGPLIREDDTDWRFRSIPARSFLVPQDCPSCLDHRIPYVAVRCTYRVHELYQKIEQPKASERGWNVEAVRRAIQYGTKSSSGDVNTWSNQPWEEWQKRYRDKNLISSYTECDVIKCAHFYVMEYTGKVSHFIVTEAGVPKAENDASDNEFLFRDVNRYDSYDQVMHVPFQNTGMGTWHSVKGIGLKSYGYEEVQNRLNCSIVDNAFLSGRMVLQGGNSQANQKMQLSISSAATFIPPGYEFVQHRLGGDIQQVMGVSNMLQNKLAQKIGAFNQRTITREDGRGEKATATEIEMAAAKEGSLSASQMDNYYLDLDSIHSETFRRALSSSDPEAKRFREQCEDAGVPMDVLKKMVCRANRLSGYGSPQMRKLASRDLIEIISALPEDGKSNAIDDIISGTQGVDKVERYNPKIAKPDMDEWMAQQENDMLHDGKVPIIISGMNAAVHLNIHLSDAEQNLGPLHQAVEDGQEIDPATLQEAYGYVSALGEHCEAHLAQIENDVFRANLAKTFEGQLKLITSFHGKLRSAIRSAMAKAAQASREQDQAMTLKALDQAKLESAQLDMQIKAQEAQQGMEIKRSKAEQQQALKRFQVGQQSKLATVQTAEKVRLSRIETAAKIQNQSLNAKSKNGSKKAK